MVNHESNQFDSGPGGDQHAASERGRSTHRAGESCSSPPYDAWMRGRGRLIGIGIGLIAGGALGAAYGFRESLPSTGWPTPGFFVLVITIIVVGVLGFVGFALRPRAIGGTLLAAAVAVVVGAPAGFVVGPKSVAPQSQMGTIGVTFAGG